MKWCQQTIEMLCRTIKILCTFHCDKFEQSSMLKIEFPRITLLFLSNYNLFSLKQENRLKIIAKAMECVVLSKCILFSLKNSFDIWFSCQKTLKHLKHISVFIALSLTSRSEFDFKFKFHYCSWTTMLVAAITLTIQRVFKFGRTLAGSYIFPYNYKMSFYFVRISLRIYVLFLLCKPQTVTLFECLNHIHTLKTCKQRVKLANRKLNEGGLLAKALLDDPGLTVSIICDQSIILRYKQNFFRVIFCWTAIHVHLWALSI